MMNTTPKILKWTAVLKL